jgi:general secretion pathway protein G
MKIKTWRATACRGAESEGRVVRDIRVGRRNIRWLTHGFTLIELLIVIVILGVLAAIAMPQFSSASREARANSRATIARTISSQVQMYKLQHGDVLPDLAAASAGGNHFAPLNSITTHEGKNFGPYTSTVPVNPVTNGSMVMNAGTITAGVPDPVPGADFIYDYRGGTGSGAVWGTVDRATGVAAPK